jgi:hypothetical protein
VESSLAILREKIVEADAVLKMALAGTTEAVVSEASTSRIPVIGQAVLGFVLPWILAMVAIPLEMLLDSGRHVVAALAAGLLSAFGSLARVFSHGIRSIFRMLPNLYDVYISIPLRIERSIRGQEEDLSRSASSSRPAAEAAGASGGGMS